MNTNELANQIAYSASKYLNAARHLTHRFRMEEAIECLQDGLAVYPDNEWFGIKIATNYRMLGDYEKSEYYLTKVLQDHPNCIFAINDLGDTLAKMGHFDRAKAVLLAAADPGPGTYQALTRVFEKEGRPDTAEFIWQQALLRYQNNSDLIFAFAFFYLRQGKIDSCKTLIETADNAQDNARHIEMTATLALLEGDREKARRLTLAQLQKDKHIKHQIAKLYIAATFTEAEYSMHALIKKKFGEKAYARLYAAAMDLVSGVEFPMPASQAVNHLGRQYISSRGRQDRQGTAHP